LTVKLIQLIIIKKYIFIKRMNDINKLKRRINKLRDAQNGNEGLKFAKTFSLMTSLGVTIAGSVFLGYFSGDYLQKKYNNDLLLILCLFAGVFLGGYLVYRLIKRVL